MRIKATDAFQYKKQGKKIAQDLIDPSRQEALIKCLRDGGFNDLADLANDARKYIPELQKEKWFRHFIK